MSRDDVREPRPFINSEQPRSYIVEVYLVCGEVREWRFYTAAEAETFINAPEPMTWGRSGSIFLPRHRVHHYDVRRLS